MPISVDSLTTWIMSGQSSLQNHALKTQTFADLGTQLEDIEGERDVAVNERDLAINERNAAENEREKAIKEWNQATVEQNETMQKLGTGIK